MRSNENYRQPPVLVAIEYLLSKKASRYLVVVDKNENQRANAEVFVPNIGTLLCRVVFSNSDNERPQSR